MNSESLLHADYLDIIFDNRNKKYGGYELRKHYNERVGKAAGILLLIVGAFSCLSLLTGGGENQSHTALTPVAPTLVDLAPKYKPMPKVIHETPPASPPPKLKTKFFTDPVVDATDNVPDDKKPEPVRTLVNTQPGRATADGDSTGLGNIPERTGKTGSGTGIGTAVAPPKPLIWVQQMPEFSGDLMAYISAHIRYPDVARESNIVGTVMIKFVVNEDGTVSDAVVARGIGGGCDEEALRMVSSMPKWKPGKQNGIPVKVYFTLPIKFVLD